MTTITTISQSDSTNYNSCTTDIKSRVEHDEYSPSEIRISPLRSSYRKSYIAWDKLERANKPSNYTEKTKYLSKNAKALLSVVYQKLKSQPTLLLNHKYISTITGSGSRQNQRIIQEIKNIIDISYKRGITELKGRKYQNCYEFKLKENSNCHHPSEKNVTNGIEESIQWTKMSAKNAPYTYIDKNNIINNRSRANFVKNSSCDLSTEKNSKFETKNKDEKIKKEEKKQESKENLKNAKNTTPEQIPAKLKNKYENKDVDKAKENRALPIPNTDGFLGSGKYLHEVLDYLTDEMCSLIRTKCGKDFTNKAIREIAKSVSRSKKGAKAFFYHIKGFIAYLAKILSFEKRDPVKISSTNYYITANQTDSEKEIREQEKYLTDIEYSLQVSPEWHLKKKLAAALQRSKAYNILTSWKSLEITKEGVAKLSLTKPVFLKEADKKIILSQIKATHERIEWEEENDGGNILVVYSLDLLMPEKFLPKNPSTKIQDSHYQTEELPKREGVWGKIRETFASYFGLEGDAIDKSWTAKLEAKIDKGNNTIELEAPSVFIKDWIDTHYIRLIQTAAEKNGFNLVNIGVGVTK